MNVTIVDSGICNLGSIGRAIERAGGVASVADFANAVASAERLILPGVGSFPAGMAALHGRGLYEAIRDFAQSGRPLLGICLGMQLLFETGEEFGETKGLGLVPGRVREIRAGRQQVPHMGWNAISPTRADPLFDGQPEQPYFYFVHSFVCEPADAADVLGRTVYEEDFCSAVQRGNVRGVQAHPEKSQRCGARLIESFLKL